MSLALSLYFLPLNTYFFLLIVVMRNNPPTFPGSAPRTDNSSIGDDNAHGAASASNLALGSFQSGDVQVRHLGLGDLGNLRLGDGAHLGLVGDARALVQTDGLHDQHGGRRSLGDEGEAAVSVDRDDDGNLVALHVLGTGVEFLDKSRDVHAVLAQGG